MLLSAMGTLLVEVGCIVGGGSADVGKGGSVLGLVFLMFLKGVIG